MSFNARGLGRNAVTKGENYMIVTNNVQRVNGNNNRKPNTSKSYMPVDL